MNLFDKAKQQKSNFAPTKKNKKDDRRQVAVKDLGLFCRLKAAVATIQGILETTEEEVKESVRAEFHAVRKTLGAKPESFRGLDDNDANASASCELRKRTSRSALTDEQIALLKEHKIEPFKQVSQVGCFVINEKYTNDQAILEKVSKALAKVPGLPSDFISMQDEQFTYIVTDEMLDDACKRKLPDEVVDVMTTIALKPKLEHTDVKKLFEEVGTLLLGKKVEITMTSPKKKGSTVAVD